MLDPKSISNFEQGIAAVREVFPPGMRAVYEGCLEHGFTDVQAFEAAKHWMFCMIMKPAERE